MLIVVRIVAVFLKIIKVGETDVRLSCTIDEQDREDFRLPPLVDGPRQVGSTDFRQIERGRSFRFV